MANSTASPKALLARTERAQAEASDPTASAWVSANAGAGKTHVLKRRVLRILLAGAKPDRLLCLTYTKAAAAEMAGRVFKDLSRWATDSDEKLEASLAEVLARPPSASERIEARKLFARAIETPGGLKVQTIHAFCERLLQRFPLEAGVPPGFTILDDTEGARLRRAATDAVLGEAARARMSPLGRALETMIAFAAGDSFDQVLAGALRHRDWLESAERLVTVDGEGLAAAGQLYRRRFGVRPDVTRASIEAEKAAVLSPAQLQRAAAAMAEGGKTDGDIAENLREAGRQTDITAKLAALQSAFMTQKLTPRTNGGFVSKATAAEYPDVFDTLTRARDRFVDLHLERHGLVVAEASVALLTIASAVMGRYVTAKAQRAALDFDDLIGRTANLLSSSDAAEWVLYKLDGGLDHVLVDEAQDTSPPQWQVIEALAREFFAGSGARDDVARSVFAVGDEKQSIYSFQGAEPAMFAASGARFEASAVAGGRAWRSVPLTLSFRTVEPLLAAVDRVFADAGRTPGLTTGRAAVEHTALRIGHAGFLEVWPVEKPVEATATDAWTPYCEVPQTLPVTRLANRIADTIAGWLRRGEMLASQGRPIRAGDVLILVRRRQPFAGPMVAALKARRIPVAGADRLALVDQIAVKDLIALAEFLVLPEDDLSLAIVLKSPLFDLDDDDLTEFAPARKGTLWSALIKHARADPRFQTAVDTLKRWRGIADQSPPFEFYAQVLDRDGGRRRLIERLGPESIDPITEFLNLALGFDEGEPPSLTGFLAWLREASPEVKRDMEHGRDEVRVLTVHGSKGLEAPIVFLPDTCSAGSPNRSGELVALDDTGLPADLPALWAWPVKGAGRLAAIEAGRSAAAGKEAEERNRLLYVAMTRARDRLYVCGFQGTRPLDPACWYQLIDAGLADLLVETTDDAGHPVRRLEATQQVGSEIAREHDLTVVAPLPPPAWASSEAPREPQLSVPLAPSQLAPYDIDEDVYDEHDRPVEPRRVGAATSAAAPRHEVARPAAVAVPDEPATTSPVRMAADNRFLRGTLTHALLEHLPTLDPVGWSAAARGFVDSRGTGLSARTRASIVAETLAVLTDPRFAPVFGPASRAEVPIVAEIPPPDGPSGPGRGLPLRLNGQIDRLVLHGDTVVILDYKTNRPPPSEIDGVASAYLYQLSAYVLALGRIYPGRTVRAAILWTDGPRLMEIPAAILQDHAQKLWQLAA